jgi:hypothetical protein
MKVIPVVRAMSCALILAVASHAAAQTPNVTLSMNVFPSDVSNPNGGGNWTIVAKTDSAQGISAITAYLNGVNTAGLDTEDDIGHDFADPWVALVSGTVNITYGQDLLTAPLVGGVGTLALSDGPDPLGDPAWDDATKIFSGTYSSLVPSFATNVGVGNNNSDANTFAQVVVGVAAIGANTSTIVRVAVPEPATIGLALCAVTGVMAVRRRRP